MPVFAGIVQGIVGDQFHIAGPAPLAHLPYRDELSLKQKAFDQFLKQSRIEADNEPIAASPFTRYYRTTTKRSVVFTDREFLLCMGDGGRRGPQQERSEALLEPKQHAAIYDFLAKEINSPLFWQVARHCSYFVIRGSYKEFCVIFVVSKLNAAIVRKLRILAERLTRLEVRVISAFIFFSPEQSRYYLDKGDRESGAKVKRLFGPDTLHLSVDDTRYLYDSVTFAQINQSMVPLMLKKTARLLDVESADSKSMRLLDLYCGFGLFGLYLGRHFSEVYGIDNDGVAIKRAQDSAAYQKSAFGNTKLRFLAGPITSAILESLLPEPGDMPEDIVLDPARFGTAAGVIAALAQRQPARVVHIFCNMDILASELGLWKSQGYFISRIIPLDMFPGTVNLEVLVLLEQRV